MKFRHVITFFSLPIIFIFVFLAKCEAGISTPSFRHYTTEDGLPSSEIYSVIQDKKGNMWMGTDRGLVKFDGYEFRTFTTRDGLTDNTVFKLYEDVKGRIWMVTISGRVFYHEAGKIISYRFNNLISETTQRRVPFGLYVDSLENIRVTLRDLGELRISNKGEKFWPFIQEDRPDLNFMIDEVSPEKLLTSVIYNVYNGSVKILYLHGNSADTINIKTPASERFIALRLKNGKLICAIENNLFEITGNSAVFIRNYSGNVYSIYEDDKNNVWTGTENGVFVTKSSDLAHHSKHFLEKNYITGIFQDREGGYWLTTLDNGVYYLTGCGIENISFSENQFQKPISLATNGRSIVYAGCFSGSVVMLNKDSIKEIHFHTALKGNPVTNLTSFLDDKIFVSRLDPGFIKENKYTIFNHQFDLGIKTNFLKRKDGNIYCGGSTKIFRIEKDSILEYAVIYLRINCIAETKDNKLLMGTNRGVFILDDATKKSSVFQLQLDSIRIDDIKHFRENLVFATKGKGVMFLIGNKIKKIDEENGLCSDLVNKVLVTGNDVWCITNKGISKISFKDVNKFEYTVSNIHNTDGLMSDEINDITILNDTMYVATNYGVSRFSSQTDFINHTPPPVFITSLRINNSEIPPGGDLKLDRNSNNIKIRFYGISYRSKDKILYNYILSNVTDTFKSTTSVREVEFLSLEPGHYKFEVSSVNSSGIKSLSPAAFYFTINPAWWQTWWFRIFFVLGGIFIVIMFYKSRVKKLKYNFEMERRQASLQLTAMRSQMNPHFIFNVMNSIRNYMQNHDMKSAEKYLTSFSKLVRYTLDNSQVQEGSLEEELSAIKNYIELEQQRFENGFDFSIVCEDGIDLAETTILSMLLQPFVENSIRHGIARVNGKGKILVDIRRRAGTVTVAIEDNGIGFDEAGKWNSQNTADHQSKGTSLTFERIKAYNKVYNKNIRTRIIHLNDGGQQSGTRVEIELDMD